MQVPNPVLNALGNGSQLITVAGFRRRFRWLIFHAWSLPLVFGFGIILLVGMLTPAQMLGILTTPLELSCLLGCLAFVLWFLPRRLYPLTDWLNDKPGSSPEQAERAVRHFPLRFWATFLIYLAIAAVSVIFAAGFYTGFVATLYDWFRIALAALIISIIVGVPVFFLILDLFGLAFGGLELRRVAVSVKARVFPLGVLALLLIDTLLVQYDWTRTGNLSFETFAFWLLLEALAIGSSLIFAHRFGQSLDPLQKRMGAQRVPPDEHITALRPRSADAPAPALQTRLLRREREQAEAELLKQAGLVQTLMDTTEEGIYGADTNGLCTFINRSGLRMLGYRQPADLLGRNLHELIHHTWPDGKPYPKEQCRVRLATMAGETAHADDELHWRADGTSFPVEYWSHPIVHNGRAVGTVVSFIDITQRRYAEQESRRQQIFLDSLVEHLPNILFVKDAQTLRYIRFNKAAENTLGYSRVEMIGKNDYDFFPREEADFFAAKDREALNNRQLVEIPEETVQTRHQGVRLVHTKKIPILDEAGQPLYLLGISEDITERKQTEKALQDSTERFRQALRAAHAGAWEWNIVTNQATWSEENFSLLGLDPRTHPASFETWIDRVHPEDRERCAREITQALDAGSDLNLEFRVVWPDGEIRWIKDVGRLVYDETGKPASMFGIQIDMTERKQAEELREANLLQLYAIVNASPVPQALNDEHQNITFLNPAFTQTFGYTREEIPTLGDWWPRAYPDPEYRQWVVEVWQATLDKAEREGTTFPPLELNVRCKDGSVKTVLASAASIGESFAGNHLVVLYDITERRKTEQALRASEERLRAILETEPECVKVLAADGSLIEMNPAGLAMIEAESLAQVQGRKMANLITREHRAAFNELGRRVTGKGESGRLEFEVVGLRGTHRWLETHAVPLYDEVSREMRLLGVTRDITERKRAEKAILTLNVELEQRVKQRTSELETTNLELEAFSYSVSHDLRAPLRAIDGFSRILLEDHAPKLNAEARGYLDRIRNAVQRMGVLIDELLELSRVGRAALRDSRVDLSHVAADVVAQLRQGEPDRVVEIDIAPGINAQGDARLLRLVLENLLGNAWKFTARTTTARIVFSAIEQDRQLVYRIEDNGAGFDMQYADKLFRPFQRLHRAQEFPGSGVGLTTVARIVHRHGGRVWAEAEIGKGAVFFFTLNLPDLRV